MTAFSVPATGPSTSSTSTTATGPERHFATLGSSPSLATACCLSVAVSDPITVSDSGSLKDFGEGQVPRYTGRSSRKRPRVAFGKRRHSGENFNRQHPVLTWLPHVSDGSGSRGLFYFASSARSFPAANADLSHPGFGPRPVQCPVSSAYTTFDGARFAFLARVLAVIGTMLVATATPAVGLNSSMLAPAANASRSQRGRGPRGARPYVALFVGKPGRVRSAWDHFLGRCCLGRPKQF